MTASYVLTTPEGMIRLNTFGDDTDNAIFQDEELLAFYAQEQYHVMLASARVLEVVASRQAYILKVITNLGLSTDGAKLSAEFRALAKQIRDQVANPTAIPEGTETYFDIAEQVNTDFQARERIRKQAQRLY